jgi:plastocyanin
MTALLFLASFPRKRESRASETVLVALDARFRGHDVFSTAFSVPGTYKYFCTHHEGDGMLGTVVVGPAKP